MRYVRDVEVGGSNPLTPTNLGHKQGQSPSALMVEGLFFVNAKSKYSKVDQIHGEQSIAIAGF